MVWMQYVDHRLEIFYVLFCSVLSGYNGTVMAYGQTGTGKTYTVGKLGKDDAAERGIMVRALEDVLASTMPDSDVVKVSYLHVLKCFYMWVPIHVK
jgi:Cdc6-like AAA superfamily ATPase